MTNKQWLVGVGMLSLGVACHAQLTVSGSHYPAGAEGIKGGSLPPAGIYLRDDNYLYIGTSGPLPNYRTLVYQQAPQLMWLTGWKILGADYGMEVTVPVIGKEVSYGFDYNSTTPGVAYTATLAKYDQSQFGLGDVVIEPLLLAWHWSRFDFRLGYAVCAPTGDYNNNSSLMNFGDGRWSQLVTVGGVWYPDRKRTWAVSILHHFEFNTQQPGFNGYGGITPGGSYSIWPTFINVPCWDYTLEWGISKTIFKTTELGLAGYYQQQFTDQTDASVTFRNSSVVGVGPEIRSELPSWGLSAVLRYDYEFMAERRPQGHTVSLTLEKRF